MRCLGLLFLWDGLAGKLKIRSREILLKLLNKEQISEVEEIRIPWGPISLPTPSAGLVLRFT